VPGPVPHDLDAVKLCPPEGDAGAARRRGGRRSSAGAGAAAAASAASAPRAIRRRNVVIEKVDDLARRARVRHDRDDDERGFSIWAEGGRGRERGRGAETPSPLSLSTCVL